MGITEEHREGFTEGVQRKGVNRRQLELEQVDVVATPKTRTDQRRRNVTGICFLLDRGR